MNPSSLGISIATRNRWRDVEKTLAMIAARPELEGCPVIMIDDGSEQPAPPALVEQYPNVEFISNGGKLGASEQRNRIARRLKTEFVLQLDDDSYPVEGSVSEAVSFLASRADIVALALNVVSRELVSPPIERSEAPYQVGVFIGCGVLFRREGFLRQGLLQRAWLLLRGISRFRQRGTGGPGDLHVPFARGLARNVAQRTELPEDRILPGPQSGASRPLALSLFRNCLSDCHVPSRNPRLGAAARLSGRDRRFLDRSFRRGPDVGQAPAAQPAAVQIVAAPALVLSSKKYSSFKLGRLLILRENPPVFRG